MVKCIKKIQLDKRQTDLLFYISLTMLLLFAFLCIGSREPVLFDDSGSYMMIERREGVMPVYPLFLFLNQCIFGDAKYLSVVIVEQAIFASACILLFTKTIKDKFSLKYGEGYLICALSLFPFTIEMPEAMITQTILTEGLAYAMFYLLVIFFLHTVWRGSYVFWGASIIGVYFLALLRSQLQLLFGVCGIVFIYLISKRGTTIFRRLCYWGIGVTGCMAISMGGIWLTAKTVNGYHYLLQNNITFNAFIMKIQDPEYYEKLSTNADGTIMESDEIEESILNDQMEEYEARRPVVTSQYTSLILSRGMYEAEPEDIVLYDNEMVSGLYEILYNAVDQERQRYAYEQKGLWMWRDIVGGVGRVGKTCLPAGVQYFKDNYADVYESDDFNMVWNHSLQEIGFKLLKTHFARFGYHTLMLLPQAFICTVFFQIRPIYLLCHLVTLFLYLSALGLMIWGYTDRKADNRSAEFMALVLATNVVMVIVISLVFFGQQRYLVYNFGIFYAAYYLLLRELWNIRIRDKIMAYIAGRRGDRKPQVKEKR